MRMIKLFTLALFAVAAVAAMLVSVASAAPTELLASISRPFTVRNSTEDVLTASTDVECSNLLGSGALNSTTAALVLVLFHKCAVLGGAFPCTTAGEPSGLIHALGLILFNRSHGTPLLLFELDKAVPLAIFVCAGASVEVKGTVSGAVTNRKFGERAHSFEFSLEASGKEQLNMVGEEPTAPMLLEAKTGSGSFETAAEEIGKVTLEMSEPNVEVEFLE